MNIIAVLAEQVKKWNKTPEAGCGLCWEFVPAGRQDYFNAIKTRDSQHTINSGEDETEGQIDDNPCCVYLGVLEIKNTSRYETGANQIVDRRYCDWNVKLIAGIPSSLDIQFYNENPDISEEEGKWEKYIGPIFSCLSSCCVDMNLCEIDNCRGVETSVEIVRWDLEMVMNYKDLNLDGVIVYATFREFV